VFDPVGQFGVLEDDVCGSMGEAVAFWSAPRFCICGIDISPYCETANIGQRWLSHEGILRLRKQRGKIDSMLGQMSMLPYKYEDGVFE